MTTVGIIISSSEELHKKSGTRKNAREWLRRASEQKNTYNSRPTFSFSVLVCFLSDERKFRSDCNLKIIASRIRIVINLRQDVLARHFTMFDVCSRSVFFFFFFFTLAVEHLMHSIVLKTAKRTYTR